MSSQFQSASQASEAVPPGNQETQLTTVSEDEETKLPSPPFARAYQAEQRHSTRLLTLPNEQHQVASI